MHIQIPKCYVVNLELRFNVGTIKYEAGVDKFSVKQKRTKYVESLYLSIPRGRTLNIIGRDAKRTMFEMKGKSTNIN